MSIVFPIESSGIIPFEPQEKIYPAFAGMQLQTAESGDIPALSTITLNGENLASSYESERLRGEILRPARAGLDEGILPAIGAVATIITGIIPAESANAASDIYGESFVSALAAAIIQQELSIYAFIKYVSFAALVARSPQFEDSLATIQVNEQRIATAKANATIREDSKALSSSLLETGQEGKYSANAAEELGALMESSSLGAEDLTAGERVELLIEVIDEILSSGRGDC